MNNFNYLTESNSECNEENYYQRRGEYIKCVLEEYARLPYVERERIYFSQFITEIQNAISNKNQLQIKTDKDKIFSVWPYKILCDPLNTANYLVGLGYCKEYKKEEDIKPCSFRISSLKSVTSKSVTSKSAFPKQLRWENLSQAIASSGVQFLMGTDTEIIVKLTQNGVNKYHRLIHLRPTYTRKQENKQEYVFQCTAAQAEFYFFKFGKDAAILKTDWLRKKFEKMYVEAANAYTANKDKDDGL